MKALALLFATLTLAAQTGVKLPQYTRRVLPNGAVLDLLPRKGVPLATVRVLVKGGAESDPAGAAGVANVTAELIRRGTATRSAEKFADELDALGAQLRTSVDEQSTVIQAEFLAKDADAAIALTADAVLHPAFPEAEVKKALAERIDQVRTIKDQPGMAVSLYFRRLLFGAEHPYGRTADEISLAKIGREQIREYHGRMYVGRNLIVAAAGDFDAGAMASKLSAAFGAAPAGAAYQWAADKPPAEPAAARLLLVNKPGATQTYFNIGHLGIRRTDPDRIALRIANTIFGGRFTSMLNDELRVNSGLTYGARSSFDEDRLTGAFDISTYTPTETTEKAIDLALDVLKRFREKGLDAEQLASAKAYIKGSFPTERLETAGQLASILASLELFGLGRDEIDGYFARIDALTLEQVNAVVRKRFGSETLTFTLVGDAAKIRATAKKYARGMQEVEIAKPGFGQ